MVPVVVISTSAAFPAIFTPVAPLIVIEPAEVVKLDAAPASMETPAFASISTPPAVALISIALVPVPAEFTVTVCAPPPTAANVKLLADPVTVTLESFVPSIVTALPLISIVPVVVISTSAAFPAIFTPVPPLSVNAPAVVE